MIKYQISLLLIKMPNETSGLYCISETCFAGPFHYALRHSAGPCNDGCCLTSGDHNNNNNKYCYSVVHNNSFNYNIQNYIFFKIIMYNIIHRGSLFWRLILFRLLFHSNIISCSLKILRNASAPVAQCSVSSAPNREAPGSIRDLAKI